ncbi:tRNA (cytidine(34)-2'-O)-methyltransferase [Psychroserpens luteus]|uniref:Putative tRNA (cytidine(34)-2'-O)-methyltransferase n=1 Tax=Psychroserpens luteus TaxID=1434066 RepID=A0ABW5ZUL8_9FLAO|nr:tRNA (cytidine(34)-2'-O)-methyltransferase [Psychroserpens luteus]
MSLNIVLFEPEIPNNTGNIGRLALATGSKLHLVKPFGFEISDSRLKRAGLDYWQHLDVIIYESIEAFFSKNKDAKFAFFSSHGEQSHWDIKFEENLFLVFGKESAGLPKSIIETYEEHLYKIPLYSEHIRSLNLANAVGIVTYEGLRQLN